MRATRWRTMVGGTAMVVLAVGASGCSVITPSAVAQNSNVQAGGSPTSTPTTAPASISVSPGDGATQVLPGTPITVTASGGTLSKVDVTRADGDAVTGQMSPDGASWTSSGPLALKATYTVHASATNPDGQPTQVTTTLGTVVPTDTANYDLLPYGSDVGVGMPVVVQFAGLVDKDMQAQVEKRVSVTTTPKVNGAWGWLDARQLIWRPAKFWTPGTKVTVTANLAGLQTRPGVWTMRNASHSFTIGSSMISTVNIATHTLTVRRNGAIIRIIPVTTGKKGFETRDGIKVILSREPSVQMNSETTGLAKSNPEYYNIKVKYAMRLTWSGEYLHAAPWSVAEQGRANVSHGCTGMNDSNAQWLFDQSKIGDVVEYVGGSRALESYNGYTMWNMSLAQWATHSALA